jgi:hypothetical protein
VPLTRLETRIQQLCSKVVCASPSELEPTLAELKLVLREHTRLRRLLAAEEFQQSLARVQSSELRQREEESEITRSSVIAHSSPEVELVQTAAPPDTARVSRHFTRDPEPLQKLLASAFIVQQSGMDAHTLSALVRVQRNTSRALPRQQAPRHPSAESAIWLSVRQPASEQSWMPPRANRTSLAKRWKTIMTVAVALWLVGWGINRAIQPARSVGASDSPKLSTPQEQPASTAEKPSSTVSTLPAATVPDAAAKSSPSKWVRVGNNELDYVTDDVTVRYFAPKHVARPVQVGENHVEYLGDDVTVRHFPRTRGLAVQQLEDRARPVGTAVQ